MPVIVIVIVPAGVALVVVTVIVEEPEPAMEVGLNAVPTPAGNPLVLNVTFPLKPFSPVIVAAYVVLLPGV